MTKRARNLGDFGENRGWSSSSVKESLGSVSTAATTKFPEASFKRALDNLAVSMSDELTVCTTGSKYEMKLTYIMTGTT